MAIVTQLIADTFGSHIGKYSERLKITTKGEVLAQAPLLHLEAVHVISPGVSISADALAACCERGIPVHFLDTQGTPYASVYAAGLVGTVLTRREQLRAYDDGRGVRLARAFAAGKIQNQAVTLKYFAKTRQETPLADDLHQAALDVQAYADVLAGLRAEHVETLREELLALEGNAARLYWGAVGALLPEGYGWTGRATRGAQDPLNSLLNYGYGILYGQVERAIVLAGLDPYAGFIHADRPGKPSLVLDLIEEFRQAAVDRVVVGLAARGFTVEQDEHLRLSDVTRRAYAQHVLEHLEARTRYDGAKHPLRQVIQMQARRLTAFLRGEQPDYKPYRAEW